MVLGRLKDPAAATVSADFPTEGSAANKAESLDSLGRKADPLQSGKN